MWKSEKITYIFLLPTVIILFLLTFYPLIYAIVISLYKIDFIKGISFFTGFDNYIRIFKDSLFWVSVRNTAVFVIITVIAEALLGLVFALFFNTDMKGKKIFRSIVLIPMLLPPITVALTWKMMYHYDYGILNYFLRCIGLNPVQWLSSTKWALMSVVLTDIWQWTPFVFLVVLASLQSIPIELYESAKVCGAKAAQRLRYITMPLIKPGLILAVTLRTIDTFRVFDKMYTLTGGGPGNSTETITFYIYRYGFKYFETGYSAAAAIIMVTFIFIFSGGYIKNVLKASDLR